jgi:hypothetical protein
MTDRSDHTVICTQSIMRAVTQTRWFLEIDQTFISIFALRGGQLFQAPSNYFNSFIAFDLYMPQRPSDAAELLTQDTPRAGEQEIGFKPSPGPPAHSDGVDKCIYAYVNNSDMRPLRTHEGTE